MQVQMGCLDVALETIGNLQEAISSSNPYEVLYLSRAQIWDVAQVSKTGRKRSLEVVAKSKVDKQVLDKEMLLVALEL